MKTYWIEHEVKADYSAAHLLLSRKYPTVHKKQRKHEGLKFSYEIHSDVSK